MRVPRAVLFEDDAERSRVSPVIPTSESEGAALLGDWEEGSSDATFGQDGKPFYVNRPRDKAGPMYRMMGSAGSPEDGSRKITQVPARSAMVMHSSGGWVKR